MERAGLLLDGGRKDKVGLLGQAAFVPGVVAGSIASLALLVLFFHPWLTLGVAIDLVLLWAVLVARWSPFPAALS